MSRGCTPVRVHRGVVRTGGAVLALVLALARLRAWPACSAWPARPARRGRRARGARHHHPHLGQPVAALPRRHDHPQGPGHQHEQGAGRPAPGVLLARPVPDHGLRRLDSALDSASNSPIGSRLCRDPGQFDDLYTADQPDLAPGKSAGFAVSAEVSALALAPTDGVYLIGVHVRRTASPSRSPARGSSCPCCRASPSGRCRPPRSSCSTPGRPGSLPACSATTTSPATSPPGDGCGC